MIPRTLRAQIGEVLRANVAEHSVEELAQILTAATGHPFSRSMTGYYMRLNGLKRGTVVLLPPEAEKYVLENYRGVGPSEMTARVIAKFGCRYDVERMKGFYGRHKLDSGITGRFAPGHVPWTKGKKGYSPPGTEKTRFQKGHMPENHREVGSERIDKDGYTLVKIAEPNVWMLKHRRAARSCSETRTRRISDRKTLCASPAASWALCAGNTSSASIRRSTTRRCC